MWTTMDSPMGPVRVIATDVPGKGACVTAIEFSGSRPPSPSPHSSVNRAAELLAGRPVGDRADDEPVLSEAVRQLRGYFARELKDFDLPLAPTGTDFQQRVWAQLCEIGYGETTSYGEIARRMGLHSGASRAVGAANGRNPVAIVIPCHRVVGSKGLLSGYAGGVERKQALLDLEQNALF